MADENKTIDDIDNLAGSDDDDFDMGDTEGGNRTQDGPSGETIEAIATFQTLLEANPNQYEAHTQLIALLKNADMFEELREAREAMNKIYPLSEGTKVKETKETSLLSCSVFVGDKQLISDSISCCNRPLDGLDQRRGQYGDIRGRKETCPLPL